MCHEATNSTSNLACERLQGLHVYPCQCCQCPANALPMLLLPLGADPLGLPSFCHDAHQPPADQSPTTKIPIPHSLWLVGVAPPPRCPADQAPSTSTRRRSPSAPAPAPTHSGSPRRLLQITWTGRLPTRSPAPDLNAPSNCLDPAPRLASDDSLDDDDMAAGLSRADEPPNYDQIKSWRSIVTLVVFVLVSKCRPCVSSWSSTLL